jgi:hypothetical protein
MKIRIDHMSQEEDGRYTIIFRGEKGQERVATGCAFCCWGETEMFDDEYITIHFERVVPIDDMDVVRAEYEK